MKKILFTILVAATFNAAAQTIPGNIPTNGLVAWYPFNGNANDESGNGNNGTVYGATLTTDRFGNSNNSYQFDGVTNRIGFNLNSINNLYPIGTESTSSVWIKTSDNDGPLISMQGNNGINYDFHIGTLADVVQNSGHYGVLVRDNCCGTGNNSFATNCADNSWHMLTVVRLNNGTLKLYKDGILESTSSSGQNGALNFNPFYMSFGADQAWIVTSAVGGCGSCNSIDQQHYNGKLDDIGIWNRALTQQEISDLYTGTNCANNTTITPQINSITTGSTASFTATTSDANPSYVWQTNFGQGFQTLNNFASYSGVNTSSLNITNVQLANHNQPIRVITTSGTCIDTSNIASIHIADTCISTQLVTVTDTLIIHANLTGISPPNNSNTIKVYPNPAQNYLIINNGNFALMSGYSCEIVNALGQQIFSSLINQQTFTIDISTWTGNGLYFLKIKDTSNTVIENRKIVLN